MVREGREFNFNSGQHCENNMENNKWLTVAAQLVAGPIGRLLARRLVIAGLSAAVGSALTLGVLEPDVAAALQSALSGSW